MVTSSKFVDGWKSTTTIVHEHAEDVVIAPDGTHYVTANDYERADLIVDHTKGRFKELGRSRWRILETSSKAVPEAVAQPLAEATARWWRRASAKRGSRPRWRDSARKPRAAPSEHAWFERAEYPG